MRPFLKDSAQQSEFDEKGYIVLQDFLSPEMVKKLHDYYMQHPNQFDKGFHATANSREAGYRQGIHDFLSTTLAPQLEGFAEDYRIILATYVVKEPGEEGFFDFHLDWSMVDEHKHRSITFWFPLEDVDAVNGNLWVVEGSHKMDHTLRGGPSMFILSESKPQELIERPFKKVELPMKAGTCVLYDHRLFHGSPANMGDHTRVAINCALIPKEAESLHYSLDEDRTKVKVFEVETDFYTSYMHGKGVPENPKEEISLDQPNFLLSEHISQLY